jgi:hypothetical protein
MLERKSMRQHNSVNVRKNAAIEKSCCLGAAGIVGKDLWVSFRDVR